MCLWAFLQVIFVWHVQLSVEFPDWQLGEVQLCYAIISICIFETSGGCDGFVPGDKGWWFFKLILLWGWPWKKLPQIFLGCPWAPSTGDLARCHQGWQNRGFNGLIPKQNQSASFLHLPRSVPQIWSMFILNQGIEKMFSLLLVCQDPAPRFCLSPVSTADMPSSGSRRCELGQRTNIVQLFSLLYKKAIAILT